MVRRGTLGQSWPALPHGQERYYVATLDCVAARSRDATRDKADQCHHTGGRGSSLQSRPALLQGQEWDYGAKPASVASRSGVVPRGIAGQHHFAVGRGTIQQSWTAPPRGRARAPVTWLSRQSCWQLTMTLLCTI